MVKDPALLAFIEESGRQQELISELAACLQWYVDNDETHEGGFYGDGRKRAEAVLLKVKEGGEHGWNS